MVPKFDLILATIYTACGRDQRQFSFGNPNFFLTNLQ